MKSHLPHEDGFFKPRIVQVRFWDSMKAQVYFDGDWIEPLDEQYGAMWSGPIPEPKEEKRV